MHGTKHPCSEHSETTMHAVPLTCALCACVCCLHRGEKLLEGTSSMWYRTRLRGICHILDSAGGLHAQCTVQNGLCPLCDAAVSMLRVVVAHRSHLLEYRAVRSGLALVDRCPPRAAIPYHTEQKAESRTQTRGVQDKFCPRSLIRCSSGLVGWLMPGRASVDSAVPE